MIFYRLFQIVSLKSNNTFSVNPSLIHIIIHFEWEDCYLACNMLFAIIVLVSPSKQGIKDSNKSSLSYFTTLISNGFFPSSTSISLCQQNKLPPVPVY